MIYYGERKMDDTKTITEINIRLDGFFVPVQKFEKVLNMIPSEEFRSAYLKVGPISESTDPSTWNLHMYTKDTRVSFQDAMIGYKGDTPISKVFKILTMAGFDVPLDEITEAREDLYITKA